MAAAPLRCGPKQSQFGQGRIVPRQSRLATASARNDRRLELVRSLYGVELDRETLLEGSDHSPRDVPDLIRAPITMSASAEMHAPDTDMSMTRQAIRAPSAA